jgi:hypothetical protein
MNRNREGSLRRAWVQAFPIDRPIHLPWRSIVGKRGVPKNYARISQGCPEGSSEDQSLSALRNCYRPQSSDPTSADRQGGDQNESSRFSLRNSCKTTTIKRPNLRRGSYSRVTLGWRLVEETRFKQRRALEDCGCNRQWGSNRCVRIETHVIIRRSIYGSIERQSDYQRVTHI